MSRVLVAAAYPDQVQAEETARALEAWRRANRSLGLSPAAVLVKRPSNTLLYHPHHMRAGRATVRGLLIGLVLLALPAAGAAALVAFALSAVLFGLLGLIGAVGDAQASFLQLVMTVGAAFLGALIVGAFGTGHRSARRPHRRPDQRPGTGLRGHSAHRSSPGTHDGRVCRAAVERVLQHASPGGRAPPPGG